MSDLLKHLNECVDTAVEKEKIDTLRRKIQKYLRGNALRDPVGAGSIRRVVHVEDGVVFIFDGDKYCFLELCAGRYDEEPTIIVGSEPLFMFNEAADCGILNGVAAEYEEYCELQTRADQAALKKNAVATISRIEKEFGPEFVKSVIEG